MHEFGLEDIPILDQDNFAQYACSPLMSRGCPLAHNPIMLRDYGAVATCRLADQRQKRRYPGKSAAGQLMSVKLRSVLAGRAAGD